MRNKHTPTIPNPYPDIGQPVVILVRLALGLSPLVIRPGHDGDVSAAHPLFLDVDSLSHRHGLFRWLPAAAAAAAMAACVALAAYALIAPSKADKPIARVDVSKGEQP